MLEYLHEKVQGWLAWAVVGIIASTFILFGASYYVNSRVNNSTKATVNGLDISRYAFETKYRRLKQQSADLHLDSDAILKERALEQLVLEKVMLSAAKNNGFFVSNNQAEAAILSTPDFQEDGVFSSRRFQQILANNQFSQAEYLKLLTNGMLNNQVRFSFIATSFLLQNELQTYVQYANQKRDYNYVLINPKKLTLDSLPTDLDYQKYYDSHQSDFMTPEKISLEYVVLSMKQELKKTTVTDSEVQQYYDENQSNFMIPAKFKIKRIFIKNDEAVASISSSALVKKLSAIKEELKSQSFDKVSEKYSDDLFSDKNSATWITLTSIDKQASKELMDLSVGQTSEPIMTDKGIEIIQLIDKQDSKLTPFNKVKLSLEKNLVLEKAQRSFQQKAEQLADLSYQNPDDLAAVADPLSLKVLKTELATRAEGFAAPLNQSKVLEAAFSNDVLKEGNNSLPIQLDDDAMVVIRVNKHVHSTLQPFEQVKAEIQAILLAERQNQQAHKLAQAIQSADLKDRDLLLEKHNLSWHKVTDALRTYTKYATEAVNQAAFNLASASLNQVDLQQLPNKEVALIILNKIKAGSVDDVSLDQQSLLIEQLASSYGIKSYDLYLQELKHKADVKVLN